jgi:hypothetical protein
MTSTSGGIRELALVFASAVAALALASCAGTSQPVPPRGLPAARMQASPLDRGDLLYYTDDSNSAVHVLTYPLDKQIGNLTGIGGDPEAICSDASGNVFVPQFRGEYDSIVAEYAHGVLSPFATLTSPGEPTACSVDPVSGDLAVAIYSYQPSKVPTGVALYTGPTGTPTVLTDSRFQEMSTCGYDDSGNLYVAGVDSDEDFAMDELPAGSSSFRPLTVPPGLSNGFLPRTIQWDGRYMTFGQFIGGDYSHQYVIYRFRITAKKATIVGTTTLTVKEDQFYGDTSYFIKGDRVVTHGKAGRVLVYNYPKGGHARTRSRIVAGQDSSGLTISVGTPRT